MKYVGNADRGDPCVTGFGAILTPGDTNVSLKKPASVDPSAQFSFVIDWKLAKPTADPEIVIPTPEIDFELGAENKTELPYCPKNSNILTRDATQELKITDYKAFLASTDFLDFDDATTASNTTAFKEYACVDKRTAEVTDTEIKVKDTIFAIGDLRMTLGK